MIILTLRTDKPEAEIGLLDGQRRLAYERWQAHRELSSTIHQKIKSLMTNNNLDFKSVEGLVCFKGPGSFTGLRIGLSVANALAANLEVPIVSEQGEQWLEAGLNRLRNGENEQIALPEYGGEAYTTKPRS